MQNEAKGYRKLEVYERAYKAGLAVYKLTKQFPEAETYGLVSQMQRASTSIPLNIAEGYAKRSSQAEFKRFLLMAVGSANEMNVLLDFAKDLKYITESQHKKASREYEEIGKMLSGLIKKVAEEQI